MFQGQAYCHLDCFAIHIAFYVWMIRPKMASVFVSVLVDTNSGFTRRRNVEMIKREEAANLDTNPAVSALYDAYYAALIDFAGPEEFRHSCNHKYYVAAGLIGLHNHIIKALSSRGLICAELHEKELTPIPILNDDYEFGVCIKATATETKIPKEAGFYWAKPEIAPMGRWLPTELCYMDGEWLAFQFGDIYPSGTNQFIWGPMIPKTNG